MSLHRGTAPGTRSSKPTRTILVADDESLFRTSVIDSLRSRFPGVRILDAEDGTAALAVLSREPVDVLVTDLQMPGKSGLDLVAYIAAQRLPIQIIVVSAHTTEETRTSLDEFGALACLDKPIDLGMLHRTVARMLQVPRARVSGVTLAGFVQLLEIEQQSCALRVASSSGTGTLMFERGTLVDARMDNLNGDDAAMEIFSMDEASLEVLGTVPVDHATITRPLSFLLLESARFSDETAATDKQDNWDILGSEPSEPATNRVSPEPHPQRPLDTAHVERGLLAAMEIDGALGAALVNWQSGLTLGKTGGGPDLDLTIAAAGTSELVRAKLRLAEALKLDDSIEDILVTLSTQYHVLHLLKRGGASLFLYVVIDRSGSNLGLARRRISKIEAELIV